jgi:hypothetical protein
MIIAIINNKMRSIAHIMQREQSATQESVLDAKGIPTITGNYKNSNDNFIKGGNNNNEARGAGGFREPHVLQLCCV